MRFVVINLVAIAFRSRYYVAWLISQMAMDLSGFSYNASNGNFDKYENCRPLEVEVFNMNAKNRVYVPND